MTFVVPKWPNSGLSNPEILRNARVLIIAADEDKGSANELVKQLKKSVHKIEILGESIWAWETIVVAEEKAIKEADIIIYLSSSDLFTRVESLELHQGILKNKSYTYCIPIRSAHWVNNRMTEEWYCKVKIWDDNGTGLIDKKYFLEFWELNHDLYFASFVIPRLISDLRRNNFVAADRTTMEIGVTVWPNWPKGTYLHEIPQILEPEVTIAVAPHIQQPNQVDSIAQRVIKNLVDIRNIESLHWSIVVDDCSVLGLNEVELGEVLNTIKMNLWLTIIKNDKNELIIDWISGLFFISQNNGLKYNEWYKDFVGLMMGSLLRYVVDTLQNKWLFVLPEYMFRIVQGVFSWENVKLVKGDNNTLNLSYSLDTIEYPFDEIKGLYEKTNDYRSFLDYIASLELWFHSWATQIISTLTQKGINHPDLVWTIDSRLVSIEKRKQFYDFLVTNYGLWIELTVTNRNNQKFTIEKINHQLFTHVDVTRAQEQLGLLFNEVYRCAGIVNPVSCSLNKLSLDLMNDILSYNGVKIVKSHVPDWSLSYPITLEDCDLHTTANPYANADLKIPVTATQNQWDTLTLLWWTELMKSRKNTMSEFKNRLENNQTDFSRQAIELLNRQSKNKRFTIICIDPQMMNDAWCLWLFADIKQKLNSSSDHTFYFVETKDVDIIKLRQYIWDRRVRDVTSWSDTTYMTASNEIKKNNDDSYDLMFIGRDWSKKIINDFALHFGSWAGSRATAVQMAIYDSNGKLFDVVSPS